MANTYTHNACVMYTYHRLSYSSGSTRPPWRHCRTPRMTDSGSKQIPRYLHVQTTLSCFVFFSMFHSQLGVQPQVHVYVHIHMYTVCIYRIAGKFGGELNLVVSRLYYNRQIKICQNFLLAYTCIRVAIPYRTESANILVISILGLTANIFGYMYMYTVYTMSTCTCTFLLPSTYTQDLGTSINYTHFAGIEY